ncbi:MAG: DNA polymerase III subunit alpha, partial [Bacteroidota bacterium]
IFELSDFDEAIEFKLFGEDYQKFRHLLEPGKALFIKASYRQKWQSDELELSISEVKLLEGLGKELTQGIILKFPIQQVTPKMVAELDALCRKFPGEQKLRMVLIDKDAEQKLKMVANERTIEADNDFIAGVERLGIRYTLEKAGG